MEPRLSDLNYNEVLLYLGYRGQTISPALEKQIQHCISLVQEASTPRLVYRRVPVLNGCIPELPLEGKDIKALLKDCREAIIMAATLGSEAERLLLQKEVTNMADAVIIDSAESTAIENVCQHAEDDFRQMAAEQGLYLTDRFSPGYGDLPLSCQGTFIHFLSAESRIGLTVTPDYLLIPRKSVTCIMGVSSVKPVLRQRGCEVCDRFRTCSYRKEKRSCHD